MINPASTDYSDEILQPLPDTDLLRYRDICADRLPAALTAHHYLTVQHRWKQVFARPENESLTKSISPKCITDFYAPSNRNSDHCTFVAISGESPTDPTNARYCIFAFTLEWPPNELISCIRDTKRIRWQNAPLIEALSDELVPIVRNLLAAKEIDVCDEWTEASDCVWMSKNQAISISVK